MIWTLLSMLLQAGIALASVAIMVALAVAGLAARLALALLAAIWRAWRSRRVAPAAASPAAVITAPERPASRPVPRPRPFRY